MVSREVVLEVDLVAVVDEGVVVTLEPRALV